MDRKRLENYRLLQTEIKSIKKEIDRLNKQSIETVKDTVKDYRTGYPKTIIIEGKAYNSNFVRKNKIIIDNLYAKLSKKQSEQWEIETWLETIDDDMRCIIRMLYIDGYSQESIAKKLGYTRSGIAMKIHRFWQ